MATSSVLTHKCRILPRLTIDSSMDYRSCSRSVGSLSLSTSTTDSSSTQSSSSGVNELVRGLYDFDGSGAEQLSFQSGEVLKVIYRDNSGWWAAHREDDSSIGWIPGSYVESLSWANSEESEDAPVVWTDMSPDSVSSTHSDLLAHYLNHPLVASPDHILSPDSIGTRSKAIPRRTISILGPHEVLGLELSPSPLRSEFVHSALEYSDSPGVHMSEIVDESPSTRELAWSASASDIVKLCPSSPSIPPPPPPPPTPQIAGIRRVLSPEEILFSEPVHSPGSAVEFLATSPDSYSTCHPRCAHRRLVRLEDGLYFRPLSVLVETMSIDSSQAEQDSPELDFPIESPSERSSSFDSLSRRVNKIKQITGDDVAQAVHDGRLAQASCPWYLRPTRGEEQIRYDYNGSVAAGTLPALVETLTSEPLHTSIDAKLRHTFLSTFRTMGTSVEVYDLLLSNFNQNQPLGLTGAEADDWRLKRLYPTQRRVLSVFRTWLVGYRMIEDDPPIARQLQEFLPSVVAPAEIAAVAQEVMDTLKRLTFAVPQGPPATATPQKRRRTKESKHELLRMDPTVLAENLCLYENVHYSKIRPQECLNRINARTGDSVANLLAFCSTHDRLASWVKHSVLWAPSLGRRANLVDFWIKVAEKCHAMHNYSSMSAIVTALSSSVISRLHLTWAHVNKTAHLTPLTQLNDPAGNFSAFRHVQRTCDLPCVPFIGPYLTDLMHINDQYVYRDSTIPTSTGQLTLFNFVKRRKWADVLDTIYRHQGKQYAFSQDASAMSQIETHLTLASGIEQTTLWSKSEEIQREERSSADLRRGLEAAGF